MQSLYRDALRGRMGPGVLPVSSSSNGTQQGPLQPQQGPNDKQWPEYSSAQGGVPGATPQPGSASKPILTADGGGVGELEGVLAGSGGVGVAPDDARPGSAASAAGGLVEQLMAVQHSAPSTSEAVPPDK